MTSRSEPEQGGFATAQYVVAVAFSLIFLVMLVNIVVFQYGRGVVQAAADEAARAAAPVDADIAACSVRGDEVLDAGLARSMRAGVHVTCVSSGDWVIAKATASFPGWLPLVPSWDFSVSSRALRTDPTRS